MNTDAEADDDLKQIHPSGFVYILSNQAYWGLLKIGETASSPYQRAQELYGTGVPCPFTVERAFFVKDRKASESLSHNALHPHRYNDSREFFKTSILNAVCVIESVLSKNNQLEYSVAPDFHKEVEQRCKIEQLENTITELKYYDRDNHGRKTEQAINNIKQWCDANPDKKALEVSAMLHRGDFG